MPWLGGTDDTCRFCRRGDENLCLAPLFTGWDVDGGYADQCLVDQGFAYALPPTIDDEQAAPLLCAGIIGYRALTAAAVPPGGAPRHLRLRRERSPDRAGRPRTSGMRVHVLTRGPANRDLAASLGVDSVGGRRRRTPGAARRRDPVRTGGRACAGRPARHSSAAARLAVAGIWLSDIPALNYDADLFQERRLRSVTANTRHDGETFLRLADRFGVRATTHAYPMDEADRALRDLAHGAYDGAAVLHA